MISEPCRHHARSCRRSRADDAFKRFRSTRDPEALADVVREATEPLFNAARSFTRDDGSAEDLVQTTFVAAIDGALRYDPGHPVVPWLLGILSNRARRQRRRERREPDLARVRREALSPDPHDALAASELQSAVQDAIADLPSIYQPVVDLHVRVGLHPYEIADALQRHRSTVRTQLSRGLAMLREFLRPDARLEAV